MTKQNAQKATMVKDLTGGNVTKLLLQFAFPLFISNALQAIYNIVDMIIVGQFIGGAGMSAVSIGGDSDTIACMTGAIAGAKGGKANRKQCPEPWEFPDL